MRVLLHIGTATAVAYGMLVGIQQGYAYATTSPRFEVRTLEFKPTHHIDEQRLRDLLALESGTNILSLSLTGLAERVAEDPWVARASVARELPDTLQVEIEEHLPVAVLVADGLFLVTAEGEVFKRLALSERERLPVITGIGAGDLVAKPEQAQRQIKRALAALTAYQERQRPQLSEIHVDAVNGVTLYTQEVGTQLVLGRGDPSVALARYDALRAAMATEVDKLAVAHLDAEPRPEGDDRIVASFFPAKEVPHLLVEAQKRVTAEGAARSATSDGQAKTKPEAGNRVALRRIPRHH